MGVQPGLFPPAKVLVKRPIAAYVDQVHLYGDLNLLGI
jgi:hypothetical protein